MTLSLIGLVLVVALAYASWTLITEAAGGQRWITLKRSSSLSPEQAWRRIEQAWIDSALTFEPVRILPDSTDTQKNFSLVVNDRDFRTSLKRFPPADPRSMTITCISANGVPFPLGRGHRKIWRVEPRGAGSVIHIAVTFQAPPQAIVQAIFTFSRQLRLIGGA